MSDKNRDWTKLRIVTDGAAYGNHCPHMHVTAQAARPVMPNDRRERLIALRARVELGAVDADTVRAVMLALLDEVLA